MELSGSIFWGCKFESYSAQMENMDESWRIKVFEWRLACFRLRFEKIADPKIDKRILKDLKDEKKNIQSKYDNYFKEIENGNSLALNGYKHLLNSINLHNEKVLKFCFTTEQINELMF